MTRPPMTRPRMTGVTHPAARALPTRTHPRGIS